MIEEIDNSLGSALPREMTRVRDLLRFYDAIPTGVFAASMMRNDLDRAARSLAQGDVVAMIKAYEALRRYSA